MLWYCTKKTELVDEIVIRSKRVYSYSTGKSEVPNLTRSAPLTKVKQRWPRSMIVDNLIEQPQEETLDTKVIKAQCDAIYAVLNDSSPDKPTIKTAVDKIVSQLEPKKETAKEVPKKKK